MPSDVDFPAFNPDLKGIAGLIFGDILGDDHRSPTDGLRRGGPLPSPRLKLKDEHKSWYLYLLW